MKIIKIDKITKQKEKKETLHVAAYARVSTGSEDQLTSFKSQKKYYENKIKNNEKWKYVGIYADEGVTGLSSNRREEFNKMIRNALSGNIDLILTKSISRFARNTVDTLKYVRLLRDRNIGILFEEENINTLTKNGEFLLTVLSSVAQQESVNISSHVKKGHEMLLKKGDLILGHGCLGYRFSNKEKKLEIVPEEAKIVKQIFNMFVEGSTLSEIKRFLENNEIKTYTNKKIWDVTAIRYILTNEKYSGDLLQKKMIKTSPFENRVINNGLAEKYLIKNHHEPIVSKEIFNLVQERILYLDNACKARHNSHNKTTLSYKIKCGYCFYSYNSSRRKNTGVFLSCRNRRNNGRVVCPESMDIHQSKVFNVVEKGLKKIRPLILNSNDSDLKYAKLMMKNILDSFDEQAIGKLVKFVFVGGYSAYKKSLPYMIRIQLFNNFPMNDYSIKKLTIEEIKNTATKQIYEGWISQRIVSYGQPGPNYFRKNISKVKVIIEVEKPDCTLV